MLSIYFVSAFGCLGKRPIDQGWLAVSWKTANGCVKQNQIWTIKNGNVMIDSNEPIHEIVD